MLQIKCPDFVATIEGVDKRFFEGNQVSILDNPFYPKQKRSPSWWKE